MSVYVCVSLLKEQSDIWRVKLILQINTVRIRITDESGISWQILVKLLNVLVFREQLKTRLKDQHSDVLCSVVGILDKKSGVLLINTTTYVLNIRLVKVWYSRCLVFGSPLYIFLLSEGQKDRQTEEDVFYSVTGNAA